MATGLYPVLETIDGSLSVFFQQQYHGGIYDFIEGRVTHLGAFDEQLAFNFIEVNNRLVVIECNPWSTTGLIFGPTRLTLLVLSPTHSTKVQIYLSFHQKRDSVTLLELKSLPVC